MFFFLSSPSKVLSLDNLVVIVHSILTRPCSAIQNIVLIGLEWLCCNMSLVSLWYKTETSLGLENTVSIDFRAWMCFGIWLQGPWLSIRLNYKFRCNPLRHTAAELPSFPSKQWSYKNVHSVNTVLIASDWFYAAALIFYQLLTWDLQQKVEAYPSFILGRYLRIVWEDRTIF